MAFAENQDPVREFTARAAGSIPAACRICHTVEAAIG
jgi:hypothetical protein